MDVSYSHGGKGSPFDVHCRRCISVNKPLCSTLLDDHTWQMVRRVANISCVMVGWVSLLVFVADSVPARWSMSIHTPAFKCGHKCFLVEIVCVCMSLPCPYGSVQYDELLCEGCGYTRLTVRGLNHHITSRLNIDHSIISITLSYSVHFILVHCSYLYIMHYCIYVAIIVVGISQKSYIHKSQSNREEQYSQDNNDNCSCHIDQYRG